MTLGHSFPVASLPARPGLTGRLQAAFNAFLAPERLLPPGAEDLGIETNGPAPADHAGSLLEPLALPPDWHTGGDLLSLSFLPFER